LGEEILALSAATPVLIMGYSKTSASYRSFWWIWDM